MPKHDPKAWHFHFSVFPIGFGTQNSLGHPSCLSSSCSSHHLHHQPLRGTHLPPSRCPPRSQTPGYPCCRPCFPQARCHCSDLQGQQKTNQGHFNTRALRYQAQLRPQGKRAAQNVTHTLHRALLARERALLPHLAPLSKTAQGKTAKPYGVRVPTLPFMQGYSNIAMALWAVEDSTCCNP